jgi:hypothetical protein
MSAKAVNISRDTTVRLKVEQDQLIADID